MPLPNVNESTVINKKNTTCVWIVSENLVYHETNNTLQMNKTEIRNSYETHQQMTTTEHEIPDSGNYFKTNITDK